MEDLAGIEQVEGVEGLLDPPHQLDRILAGLLDQEAHLVQADAMLAGAGAIERQRQFDDPVVERLGVMGKRCNLPALVVSHDIPFLLATCTSFFLLENGLLMPVARPAAA